MLSLSEVASRIELSSEGLWIAGNLSEVSYPEQDNDICFAVEDESFWFVHRNQCILAALNLFPPPGTFFDVGGGNGYVAKALQDRGLEVVLVEPGVSGTRNAQRRGVATVVRSTLKDAGFHAAVLPAVGLFDVVEHIADDSAFLTDVHAYLVPGGRVYLTVPAFQSLWSHEDVDAGHWRRYTVSKICNLLANCGYEVECATYIFGFLPLPIFLLRALPFSLGLAPWEDFRSRAQKDHQIKNPVAHAFIGMLSRRELKRIASGQRVGMGASCLVVARKPSPRDAVAVSKSFDELSRPV